jgi:hypothetical protein
MNEIKFNILNNAASFGHEIIGIKNETLSIECEIDIHNCSLLNDAKYDIIFVKTEVNDIVFHEIYIN